MGGGSAGQGGRQRGQRCERHGGAQRRAARRGAARRRTCRAGSSADPSRMCTCSAMRSTEVKPYFSMASRLSVCFSSPGMLFMPLAWHKTQLLSNTRAPSCRSGAAAAAAGPAAAASATAAAASEAAAWLRRAGGTTSTGLQLLGVGRVCTMMGGGVPGTLLAGPEAPCDGTRRRGGGRAGQVRWATLPQARRSDLQPPLACAPSPAPARAGRGPAVGGPSRSWRSGSLQPVLACRSPKDCETNALDCRPTSLACSPGRHSGAAHHLGGVRHRRRTLSIITPPHELSLTWTMAITSSHPARHHRRRSGRQLLRRSSAPPGSASA